MRGSTLRASRRMPLRASWVKSAPAVQRLTRGLQATRRHLLPTLIQPRAIRAGRTPIRYAPRIRVMRIPVTARHSPFLRKQPIWTFAATKFVPGILRVHHAHARLNPIPLPLGSAEKQEETNLG